MGDNHIDMIWHTLLTQNGVVKTGPLATVTAAIHRGDVSPQISGQGDSHAKVPPVFDTQMPGKAATSTDTVKHFIINDHRRLIISICLMHSCNSRFYQPKSRLTAYAAYVCKTGGSTATKLAPRMQHQNLPFWAQKSILKTLGRGHNPFQTFPQWGGGTPSPCPLAPRSLGASFLMVAMDTPVCWVKKVTIFLLMSRMVNAFDSLSAFTRFNRQQQSGTV